jgi:hypothetical protein
MTQQRAAKRYCCAWCGQHILKGEVYNRQSGVYDGDFQCNHWHPECWEAAAFGNFEEFTPGDGQLPPSAADLEVASWNVAALFQGSLL